MTTLSSITLKCPVCNTTFGSKVPQSCGLASKRTDFRPNYWGMNPVEWFFHLCPNCGFCARLDVFEQSFDASQFVNEIKAMDPLKDPSLSSKIERAMVCLEKMREVNIKQFNEYEMSQEWIHAYWWSENAARMEKFGKIVLDYLKKAIERGQVPNQEVVRVKYLMGEIHRRIGNTEMAEKLFDEVISLAKENGEDRIRKLAKQQKTSPKERL